MIMWLEENQYKQVHVFHFVSSASNNVCKERSVAHILVTQNQQEHVLCQSDKKKKNCDFNISDSVCFAFKSVLKSTSHTKK